MQLGQIVPKPVTSRKATQECTLVQRQEVAEFENKVNASRRASHQPIPALMVREIPLAEVAENAGDENEGNDLAYDPDQDIQEKRQIRRGYRALLDETSGE